MIFRKYRKLLRCVRREAWRQTLLSNLRKLAPERHAVAALPVSRTKDPQKMWRQSKNKTANLNFVSLPKAKVIMHRRRRIHTEITGTACPMWPCHNQPKCKNVSTNKIWREIMLWTGSQGAPEPRNFFIFRHGMAAAESEPRNIAEVRQTFPFGAA